MAARPNSEGMKALCVSLLLLASPALAVCPPLPDRSAERTELMEALATSDTFKKGETAVRDMWLYYRTAPNETAQELLNGGLGAIRVGDWITAVDVLSELVAYCPEYSEGYNQLAFAYFLRGEDAASEALLKKALEFEPQHFGALSGLGLIYYRTGRPALARVFLQRAVDVNPWSNERSLLDALPEGDDL